MRINSRVVRHNNKNVISICLLFLLVFVSLTACSNVSGKRPSNDPATMLSNTGTITGSTLDNSAEIAVAQLTATMDKQNTNDMIIIGTYELTNVSTVSLPYEVINFGVLDKQADARYWGSTSVSGRGEVAPQQTVNGMFAIQVPRTIDLKQCDLIFGKIPNINFQKPLVSSK